MDLVPIQDQILGFLEMAKSAGESSATLDPASSEHNYHLKTAKGASFIENYDSFYSAYSMVGFQELTDEAKAYAQKLSFGVDQLSPSQRLRGMKDTRFEKYHPFYDERNYTKPTRFYTGAVAELLDGFKDQACRSALVCLGPNKFISSHFDIGPEFITRLMFPVITNDKAVLGVRSGDGFNEYHLKADGSLYFINAGYEHYAYNGGAEPRFQIRICVNGQRDLEDLEVVEPINFVSDADFADHPCATVEQKSRRDTLVKAENILSDTLKEFNLSKSGKACLT